MEASDDNYEEISLDVSRIVSDALTKSNTPVAGMLDVSILEQLSKVLGRYLDPSDASFALSEIRKELYSGYSVPSPQRLQALISRCIKCKDDIAPDPQPTRWNAIDPDLLIIGLAPNTVDPHLSLLVDGLKQGGFSSARCALTYLIRCSVPKENEAGCMSNCVSYSHEEINVLKPRLVVCLSMPVFQAVTGRDVTAKFLGSSIVWQGLYPYMYMPALGQVKTLMDRGSRDQYQEFIGAFATAHRFIYGEL